MIISSFSLVQIVQCANNGVAFIHSICVQRYEFSIIKIMDMYELLVTRDTILETNSVSTATCLLTNLVVCNSNVEKKRERETPMMNINYAIDKLKIIIYGTPTTFTPDGYSNGMSKCKHMSEE